MARLLLFLLGLVVSVFGQCDLMSFSQTSGSVLLADSSTGPSIYVADNDWPGVHRTAQDLAWDFGRVTGANGTYRPTANGMDPMNASAPIIIAGTIGKSSLIDALIQQRILDVGDTEGKWEAYQTLLVADPSDPSRQALVIAGADKRGTIYGIYDLSQQIGVSPWYWWADVAPLPQKQIYVRNITKKQGSPSVKYRGIFINDEQPAISNWVAARFPRSPETGDVGFDHEFWSLVYELLLRLRANYFWATTWGAYAQDYERFTSIANVH